MMEKQNVLWYTSCNNIYNDKRLLFKMDFDTLPGTEWTVTMRDRKV